jgi:hypothetical protein
MAEQKMQSASGGKKSICLATLDKVHEAYLFNYLKATGIKVELLVNFKHPGVEIKRVDLNLFEGHDGQ